MGKFLSYSELDTALQRRMSEQAPDEAKRLGAIQDAMQDVYAEFDIQAATRSFIFSIVPDGDPYGISNLVDDFKRMKDLRYISASKHVAEYVQKDDDDFTVNIGQQKRLDEFSVDYNNGELYLKVNSRYGACSVGLNQMASLTANGTWTADTSRSDATNIGTTESNTLDQNESINFDIDVSQSVNNYAIISTDDQNEVDLSDYIDRGRGKFRIYLPTVTNFTSVEMRWGSSSSAYYSKAVTKQADGSALVAGWNFIDIDWAGLSPTGSPDMSATDYVAIKLNYTASYTDQVGVVVEAINMLLPENYKEVYYTYYDSQDSSGDFQEDLTATTGDTLLMEKRFKKLMLAKALRILWPMAVGAEDAAGYLKDLRVEERIATSQLSLDTGSRPKVAVKKLKVRRG